jgi:hypothetical protein
LVSNHDPTCVSGVTGIADTDHHNQPLLLIFMCTQQGQLRTSKWKSFTQGKSAWILSSKHGNVFPRGCWHIKHWHSMPETEAKIHWLELNCTCLRWLVLVTIVHFSRQRFSQSWHEKLLVRLCRQHAELFLKINQNRNKATRLWWSRCSSCSQVHHHTILSKWLMNRTHTNTKTHASLLAGPHMNKPHRGEITPKCHENQLLKELQTFSHSLVLCSYLLCLFSDQATFWYWLELSLWKSF